jgi:hypothetical protein
MSAEGLAEVLMDRVRMFRRVERAQLYAVTAATRVSLLARSAPGPERDKALEAAVTAAKAASAMQIDLIVESGAIDLRMEREQHA